ncbi:hypothetical protein BKI52_07095 [marine bacterium AO1-C]|nr:hypothetical protein BKI52_07095 [marine bacterium AO1-C]
MFSLWVIGAFTSCQTPSPQIDISQAKFYQSAAGAYLYALDANTGKEIWKFKAQVSASAPVVSDNLAFFTDESNLLYAVNAKTGVGEYSKYLHAQVTGPLQIDGEQLYYLTKNAQLHCRSKGTGKEQWVSQLAKVPFNFGIGKKRIYIPFDYTHLQALDKQNGTQIWKHHLAQPLLGTPTEVEHLILVSTESSTIAAYDTVSKKIAWSRKIQKPSPTSPILHSSGAYWGLASGKITGFDPTNGQEFWSYQLKRPVLSNPLIHNDVIYYGANDKRLYAQSLKTKEILWTFQSKYWVMTTPRFYQGKIYFTDGGGSVYCVDITAKKLLWQYRTNGTLDLMRSFVIKNGMVYFGGDASPKVMAPNNTLEDMREFYSQ